MQKEQFIQAAEELNKALGLEPVIPLDSSEEDFVKYITEAASLVTKDDTFNKVTWMVLVEVGGLAKEVEEKAKMLLNIKLKKEKGEKKMANEKGEKKQSIASILTGLMTEGKYTKAQIVEKAQCKGHRYDSHAKYLVKKGNTITVHETTGVVSMTIKEV